MEIQPTSTAILEMVDRIVESDADEEVQSTKHDIRLMLRGAAPSCVLNKLVISPPDNRYEVLRAKLENAERRIAELVADNERLVAESAELSAKIALYEQSTGCVNGHYTMQQFLSTLIAKLGRSYGWRGDYILATQTSADCTPVANETIQKWRVADLVPDWAVDQIEKLQFPIRTGTKGRPKWRAEEEDYLADIYRADPSQKNVVLALRCETEFGRDINENSIKGALDRLRKKNLVDQKRP